LCVHIRLEPANSPVVPCPQSSVHLSLTVGGVSLNLGKKATAGQLTVLLGGTAEPAAVDDFLSALRHSLWVTSSDGPYTEDHGLTRDFRLSVSLNKSDLTRLRSLVMVLCAGWDSGSVLRIAQDSESGVDIRRTPLEDQELIDKLEHRLLVAETAEARRVST